MPTDNQSLEETLARIVSMLGVSLGSPSQPGTGTTRPGTGTGQPGTGTTRPGTGTTQPGTSAGSAAGGAPSSGASFSTAQQETIARQVFYSMTVPLITREKVLEMERRLPSVIEELKSLQSRPLAKAEIMRAIEAVKQQSTSTERGEAADARTAAFAETLHRDVFGEGERILPLIPVIGLGLAFFMGGYTIAHGWGK